MVLMRWLQLSWYYITPVRWMAPAPTC